MKIRIVNYILLAIIVGFGFSLRVDAQASPRATTRRISSLVSRIVTKTDAFKRAIEAVDDRDGFNSSVADDRIDTFIEGFVGATGELRSGLNSRSDVSNEVSEVLRRASYIDGFMRRKNLDARTESRWTSLRSDLNTLAWDYRVSWNWNQTLPPYPTSGTNAGLDPEFTGTYRLNTRLSDKVATAVNRSVRFYPSRQRANVRRNLERRLASPELLAIDKDGRSITIASSNSPRVSFAADGIARTETNARGRTFTTTAATNSNALDISYVGERSNDFYLTFRPAANGRLKVTRRIYLENRNDQVTVASVYDKINTRAEWATVYRDRKDIGSNTGIGENFYIADGVRLTAVLNNRLDTDASQVGDRFTMRVTSPSQYRGAVIGGHVAEISSSGRLSGRANVSLDFDSIRLSNGRTYQFAGMVDSVRALNGETVSVNNEGTVRDSSQTTKTVTRAGIGAAIGAIIGAITGGGKGAAIGAGIGAGAGAGSVLIMGRDDIEIPIGSEFTVIASAPGTVGEYQ